MIRWANVIGPDTIEELNERVVELACALKVTQGRKLRTDGTVVETDIHYPTDSGLLADGVRVLGGLARKAKSVVDDNVRAGAPEERFRDRSRSARRLTKKIDRLGRRRSRAARDAYQQAYGKLLKVARTSVKQAEHLGELLAEATQSGKRSAALSEDSEHFSGLLYRIVSQTERRVLQKKPTEFSRKIWLSEVEGGIISSYRILDGNPADTEQIQSELDYHLRLFGEPPKLLAADRGCYSQENERLAKTLGVKRACLPQPGAKTEKRKKPENQRWFKRGQRFRAGCERRISVLKRRGHLGRCVTTAKRDSRGGLAGAS